MTVDNFFVEKTLDLPFFESVGPFIVRKNGQNGCFSLFLAQISPKLGIDIKNFQSFVSHDYQLPSMNTCDKFEVSSQIK